MKTFLSEVVEELIAQNTDFKQTTIILPGVRPKAFIKKTFAESGFHGILPQMQTIEEFLEEITGLKLISALSLLFSAFEAHKNAADEPKSFEDFLKFAPTLLKDFDDIEASLCDDKALLNNLISEERIKKWGASMDVGLSELMLNHLGFWTAAQKTLYALRTNLLEEGKAFRGLLVKQASLDIESFAKKTTKQFVYIGFNAFTNAEQKVLESLINHEKVICYWDADTYYLNDPKQEAGQFLRSYQATFSTDFKFVKSHFEEEKSIEIVKVPKHETQAKFVGKFLENIDTEQRNKTAIVLADEQLLPAVLNALPNSIDKLNVTMGLPLSMVSMSSFFKELFQMYLSQEKFEKPNSYYFRNVLDLLMHSDFSALFQPQSSELISQINQQNIIFLSSEKLNALNPENPHFSVFNQPNSIIHLLEIIIDWINLVHENEAINSMQQEYLFRFRSIFMQLKDLVSKHSFVDSYKVLHQLYQQLLQVESVSFVGEPLVGLQLMGLLETRLLDFENIILTSVNEGTLPLGRQENSFIPFDFRKNFRLNTFLENDSIYAYHFYRLIQRCKSATFLYNTDSEGIGSGEPSRFLLQLLLESKHKIKEITASPDYTKKPVELLEIQKNSTVQELLNDWKNRISPTSLTSYLYNPIDFYQRQIIKVGNDDEVEEIAGDQTIGNIVHNTLEKIYTPFLGLILRKEDFDKIEKSKEAIFQSVVDELLLKGNEVRGKNILILSVAKEMIDNTLRKDAKITESNELVITALEQKFEKEFVTPENNKIKFAGKIDRIESLNGVKRVLDYKTGSSNAYEIQLKSDKLNKLIADYKGAKPIQLAIYAFMLGEDNIQSGIYPLRYFTQDVQLLELNGESLLNQNSIEPIMDMIGNLVDEILNPEIPFKELEKD